MTKRLTDYEKDQMRNKVTRLLERRDSMAVFPFDQSQLYSIWQEVAEPDVVNAISTLVMAPGVNAILSGTCYITFKVGEYELKLSVNDSVFWFSTNNGVPIPPHHEAYKPLHDFCEVRERTDRETGEVGYIARSLIYEANAAGQIKRVWPELASFLSTQAHESTRGAVRASRIPKGFSMNEFNEKRDMCNRVLAEAHILPNNHRESISIEVRKEKPTPA